MTQTPLTLLSDVKTFAQMAKAIVAGRYKMPWGTFFWMVLCTLYFLSPIDALPDILPLLGFADDGAFLVFVLLLLHKDLANFRQYQAEKDTVIEAEVVEEKDHDQKTH